MSMNVTLQELAPRLGDVMSRVRKGEEVTISEAGSPIAQIVPVKAESAGPRGYGAFRQRGWISDDFNNPLPDDELKEWGT